MVLPMTLAGIASVAILTLAISSGGRLRAGLAAVIAIVAGVLARGLVRGGVF